MGLGELTVGLAQPDTMGTSSPGAQFSGYKGTNVPDTSQFGS